MKHFIPLNNLTIFVSRDLVKMASKKGKNKEILSLSAGSVLFGECGILSLRIRTQTTEADQHSSSAE
jgi:hypothetical protein